VKKKLIHKLLSFCEKMFCNKLLAMNVHSKTFLIDRETFNSLSWD